MELVGLKYIKGAVGDKIGDLPRLPDPHFKICSGNKTVLATQSIVIVVKTFNSHNEPIKNFSAQYHCNILVMRIKKNTNKGNIGWSDTIFFKLTLQDLYGR